VVVWGIGLIPAHHRLRVYVRTYANLHDLNEAFALSCKAPPHIRVGAFSTRYYAPHVFAGMSFCRTRLSVEQLAHEAMHVAFAFADRAGWPAVKTGYVTTNAYSLNRAPAGNSREEHMAHYIGRLTKHVWHHWQVEGWVK
jgi:hypothetical protein